MKYKGALFLLFFLQGCAIVRLPSESVPNAYKEKPFVERQYPAEEKYLQLGDIKVCYIEKGTGPTLLILPGLSLGAHNWRFNLKRYWDKYHVVLMDFPGYGKSGVPNVDYTIGFFKKVVLDFMEAKGIEHAVILGHSLGGQVGIVLAAEHPEKVDALILETATGTRRRYGFLEDLAIQLYITADRFAFLPEDKLRKYTEVNFYAPVPAQEELIEYQLSYRAHFGDTKEFKARNEAFVRGATNIILEDVRPYASKILVPTLLLWGRQDNLGKVSNAYWLYKTIPKAQLYVIERCGHQPHLEKPMIYDFAVLRFLQDFFSEAA